jgi:hypothetical protein
MTWVRRRSRLAWLAAALFLVGAVIAAGATAVIPAADGTITGCYKKNNGQLRVVDTAGDCHPSELALTWNQQGQPGPPGPPGPQGEQGDPGPGVPTVSGFVRPDGSTYGGGFTVTKLGTGHYFLDFPLAAFGDFPAIATSGWGIPGAAPTVNVVLSTVTATVWRNEIRVVAPDGTTPVGSGFQFVAAQVS